MDMPTSLNKQQSSSTQHHHEGTNSSVNHLHSNNKSSSHLTNAAAKLQQVPPDINSFEVVPKKSHRLLPTTSSTNSKAEKVLPNLKN